MREPPRLPIREPDPEGKDRIAIAAFRSTLETARYASPKAIERKCSACGHTVVIGPGSQELLKRRPDARIVCMECQAAIVDADRVQTSAQRLDADIVRARIKNDPP